MPDSSWLPNAGVVWLQPGGPGYGIKISNASTTMEAPSGVDAQGRESRYVRSEDGGPGQFEYVGAFVTGNPERPTFQLMQRLTECDFLDRLKCARTILALRGCSNRLDLLSYKQGIAYTDAFVTSKGYSANLVNGTDQTEDDLMQQVEYSAGEEVRFMKLRHDNISGTASDIAINKVISVGVDRCAGDCGKELSIEDEFWLVTDRDSTPGYQSVATPRFGYTEDGGGTWTFSDINVFPTGDAVDVIRYGGYALVASPEHGIAYARVEDIKDGLTGIWSQVSGLVAGNEPLVLAVVNGTIYAAGENGYIYQSTDGVTFEVLSAGTVTTNDINSIAVAGCDLVYFGADGGDLVKLEKGALSSVTVKDANGATVTSNINVVRVPPNRGYEIYVGCANGNIYASRDEGDSWRTLAFDGAGSGLVKDIQFARPQGLFMFILQTNANGKSRVHRDLSGGAGGLTSVEIVGSYNSPANSGMNSIAVATPNLGITVGEVNNSYGFIGKVLS